MTGQRVPRMVIVLGAVILVLAVAVAVLVTLLLTSDRDSSSFANTVPEGVPSVSAESPESMTTDDSANDPTPVATTLDGVELPAFAAAVTDCRDVWPENGWATIDPYYGLSPDFSPPVVEVLGEGDNEVGELLRQSRGFRGKDPLEMHKCVLDVIGAPPGVAERMANTRALDGTQTENWPGFKVTWSYHPDTGLDAVFSYALNE